jgi:hypothetical protein
MARKKGRPNFNRSEPEFLISCMDRHDDWAVVVCLVGGGQEINTGEAGIGEWLTAVKQHFPTWEVHVSPNLSDSEYAADEAIRALQSRVTVVLNEDLHLSVSMRSFRAEHVSAFVKHLLDRDIASARATFDSVCARYPIAITRDPSGRQELAQGKGTRFRTIRNRCFVSGRTPQTSRHQCAIAHGSHSLVSGQQRRCTVILLSRRRCDGISRPGTRTGLGMCGLGRGPTGGPFWLEPSPVCRQQVAEDQ